MNAVLLTNKENSNPLEKSSLSFSSSVFLKTEFFSALLTKSLVFMPSSIKKIVVISLIFIFASDLFAPVSNCVTILVNEPADPFRNLIHAIGRVETKFDTLAYNPIENAVGYFQIRPIRLRDYNARTGNRYRLKDLYNYETSEKIFLYYASEIGPYKIERIAKNWNGSGKKTIQYWRQVKKYL